MHNSPNLLLKSANDRANPLFAINARALWMFSVVSLYAGSTSVLASDISPKMHNNKEVIYQVLPRLFGNTNTTNKPWGSLAENGVGKFADFDAKALQSIKELGVTHIWYTGVLHHASTTDYREDGISLDDPDVIKGRAGSPYAIRDYYNVSPDLAREPKNRMAEFEALIKRTHDHGMKVIIDIVPNHVARSYFSPEKPEGVQDFGSQDNKTHSYQRNNNFYYVINQSFTPPKLDTEMQYPSSFKHPLWDGKFIETPAKWTGNGARNAQPKSDDWYETVKLNYGVKPDGSHDFPPVPEKLRQADTKQHAAFWSEQDVPDTWKKFRQITQFWLDKGVDGFRYDVAELVPVAFWSYLNSHIKRTHPDTLLLAEVYDPSRYRDFIQLGRMDYLYDKVGFYDTIKKLLADEASINDLEQEQQRHKDIHPWLLRFLENHDEQRLTSPQFAGNPQKAKPAVVTSLFSNTAPFLLYFGQEVGEDGSEEPGFGAPSRTSIFDYIGVPAHQRWMNAGLFDGGQSTVTERQTRDFYQRILQIATTHPAVTGNYLPLTLASNQPNAVFAFARCVAEQCLIVISNFDHNASQQGEIALPEHFFNPDQRGASTNQLQPLYRDKNANISAFRDGILEVSLPPSSNLILSFTASEHAPEDNSSM